MATVKGSVEMWQHAAVTLTTCVIAMAGFWLMEGKEYATRTEISLMIRKESPYTVDRALIMQQMSDSTAINKSLTDAVNGLQVTLARLEERLQKSNGSLSN